MIRPSYRANMAGDRGRPFFGMIVDPSQSKAADPDDLSGGTEAARRFIGWQTFFDFGDGEVKPNKRIDTTVSTPLFRLPFDALRLPPGHKGPRSLPQRTLLRHLTWELPSGQTIARLMGQEPLAAADRSDFDVNGLDSHLAADPSWEPRLPSRGEAFRMVDFLTFAGVDPASRGQ